MEILISNYRYFVSGGPERYLFNIKKQFEENGHNVYPFSIRSQRNVESEYESYFMSPIGSDKAVYFDEYKKNLKTIFQILSRQFYSPEGYFKAKEIAKMIQPDIIYILHFLNKMSPSILDGFKSTKAPLILRVSDFGLICPQAHLFSKGEICESCIGGNYFNAVKKKCIKNSIMGSLIKALALSFHKARALESKVDAFVFPSRFTMRKFIEAGLPEEKMNYIPTFIDLVDKQPDYIGKDYILYFGRVTEEKGVDILLEAYNSIKTEKPRLIIIGGAQHDNYVKQLKEKCSSDVHFLDFMPSEQLKKYIQEALFVVIPSECYDNLPNVLLESFAYGKTVCVPRHGCFSDIVDEGVTGLFYQPGDSNDFAEKLTWAFLHPTQITEMGKHARAYVEKYHSPEKHYTELIALFDRTLTGLG
jgi:glycosyltransferase involved in cell wall biosynthesis